MAFDRQRAGGAVVEIVDALNGDRVVGTGFRLLDATIVTSCQCLPRLAGKISLPDPDAPNVIRLVRVRRPGTADAALGIVTTAEPFSMLAALRSATIAGLTVPDELNPDLSFDALVQRLEPAVPALAPGVEGRVLVCTREGRWVAGAVRASTIALDEALGADATGAPVFDEGGLAVGLVTLCEEGAREARVCALADHLPGWAIREARERAAAVAPHAVG